MDQHTCTMFQNIFRCFFLAISLISSAAFLVDLTSIVSPNTNCATWTTSSINSVSFSHWVLAATTDATSTPETTTTDSDTKDIVSNDRAAIRNLENYEEMLQCTSTTKAKFQGKTVLLTGASGGLGKELALQFAECGVAQILLSGRNAEVLELVAQECQERCPTPLTTNVIPCDLADPMSVQRLGDNALQVASNGIDILVNNGGVSSRSAFVDTQLEVDTRVMQINFLAGAALAKVVVPSMLAKEKNGGGGGGSIIWISSVQGLIGIPGRTSYAASKFAVQGYCESLRAELASSGISVHVVSPGYIRTNLSKSALTGDGTAHGRMDETTLKGRPPKEVAVTLLNAVAKGKGDIVVAATVSAKIAIWLRFFFPTLLQRILVKRFDKEQALTAASTTTEEPERPKID